MLESEVAPSANSAIEHNLPSSAPAQPVARGELVEPREAWLPQEARELFTDASRLLRRDPYLLHAPANTQRARRADWALFCAFCEGRGVPAMPASPDTVVAFLEAVRASPPLPGGRPQQARVTAESLARRARRAKGASVQRLRGRPRAAERAAKTIERYNTSIATAHRLADQPDPTRVGRVRNALHALMSGLRASRPRAPLRREQLLEVMAGLWPEEGAPSFAGRPADAPGAARSARRGWRGATLQAARLWDLRARALLACLYPTMTRRSEILELRVEELPQARRDGVIAVQVRKTAQQEHRYLDALALQTVKQWCQAAGIESGPVFRGLDSRGRIGGQAIRGPQVVQIVRACWAHRVAQAPGDAGLSAASVSDLGAHSTRIGAAHDLVAAGQELLAIMHSGGWKDPRMPRKYIQELQAADSGMARMLRRRRSRTRRSSPAAPAAPSVRARNRTSNLHPRAVPRRKTLRRGAPPPPRKEPGARRARQRRSGNAV